MNDIGLGNRGSVLGRDREVYSSCSLMSNQQSGHSGNVTAVLNQDACKKVKFSLEEAMKTQRECGGLVPLFL